MEGEGGGVEVMLIGAPDWEGGDPSMMSSESTVEGQEEHLETSEAVRGQRAWGGGAGIPEVDMKFCSTMPTFTS